MIELDVQFRSTMRIIKSSAQHCVILNLSPEQDSLDVVAVSLVDGVDGAAAVLKLLLQDDPALLDDDGLDVGVQQQDEVGHLRVQVGEQMRYKAKRTQHG